MTETIRKGQVVAELVRELGETLTKAGRRMAVAESCTGGGLGAAITDRAGSSAYFLGGVVAYDNRIKRDLLDVPDRDITRFGAVSLPVAQRMAAECRRRLGADLAVSITGIAGPGGGSPEKPVGLVYIGVATALAADAKEFHFAGDRAEVRRQAVETALRLSLEAARRLDAIQPSR
jgi:PncC family amidohydrolase